MGVTAVSLATLRPLFHSFLVRMGFTTANNTAQGYEFSKNNSRPRGPLRSSSGHTSITLKKAYTRHDGNLFAEDDDEMQLRGIASTMGNISRVEAGLQRVPSKKAMDEGWPLQNSPEKEGIRTTWVKGDSENNSTRISEEEIVVTTTTHVSGWSANNGPIKAFLV